MNKSIKAELKMGLDSCMRVVSVLRKNGIEASELNYNNNMVALLVSEKDEFLTLENLKKLSDVVVIGS